MSFGPSELPPASELAMLGPPFLEALVQHGFQQVEILAGILHLVRVGEAATEGRCVIRQEASCVKVKISLREGIAFLVEVVAHECAIARFQKKCTRRDHPRLPPEKVLRKVLDVDFTGQAGQQRPRHEHAGLGRASFIGQVLRKRAAIVPRCVVVFRGWMPGLQLISRFPHDGR